MTAGLGNECSRLVSMVVKRPQESLTSQYLINSQWESAGWSTAPDFNRAAEQHFQLCRFLSGFSVSCRFQPEDWVVSMNSIFIRDAVLMTSDGQVIQCLIRNSFRIGEPEECVNYLQQLGLTCLGEVKDPGQACGADFVWLRKDLLLAALTAATDEPAVDQITNILKNNPATADTRVLVVDMRETNQAVKNRGTRCHLVSALSLVKPGVVVLCPERFPKDFVEAVLKNDLQFTVVPVTLDEWAAGAAEFFCVSPERAFVVEAGTATDRVTRVLAVEHGIKVKSLELPALREGKGGITSMILATSRE